MRIPMKSTRKHLRWGALILSLSCSVAGAQLEGTTTGPTREEPVKVTFASNGAGLHLDARGRFPLQDAINYGNVEYGFDNSFEAAPTVRADEISDGDPERRRRDPESKEGYFAKSPQISIDLPVTKDIKPLQKDFVDSIVRAYNAASGPGTYSVEGNSADGYVVVGRRYRNADGNEVAFVPPLDCVVSVEFEPMRLHDALGKLARAIAAKCSASITAEWGDTFPGASQDSPVSGSFAGMPARQVLQNLLSQERRTLFYVVSYVPVADDFELYVEPTAHRNKFGGHSTDSRPRKVSPSQRKP
jgi:hypothetical protein